MNHLSTMKPAGSSGCVDTRDTDNSTGQNLDQLASPCSHLILTALLQAYRLFPSVSRASGSKSHP